MFNLFHTYCISITGSFITRRFQAALGEQTEATKYSQEEYERLLNVTFSTLIAYHLIEIIL